MLAGFAALVVDVDEPVEPDQRALATLSTAPCPVILVAPKGADPAIAAAADVVFADHGLPGVAVPIDRLATEPLLESVAAHPAAGRVLVQVLRASETLPVSQALTVESLGYSVLLGSEAFRTWRASRPSRPGKEDSAPPVLAHREGARLHLLLNRPASRNAYSRAVRDALAELLDVAAADDDVAEVVIAGAGLCFSSGGDLREFGLAADMGYAHEVRIRRNVGHRIHRLADRVTVLVHGTLFGAGVELSAFAGRVVADPGTTFCLPEISMGLIPGAGGTVSVARRIGRQRCAYLALSGETLSADDALGWGLVDEIAPIEDWPVAEIYRNAFSLPTGDLPSGM